jgi:hypothetical protein
MVEESRNTNISALCGIIARAISKYQGSELICSTSHNPAACDAIVLGSLIKTLAANGLWPIPEPPYKDITITDVLLKIFKLTIVSLCDESGSTVGKKLIPPAFHSAKGHGLRHLLEDEACAIYSNLTGLDLKTFKRQV